MKITAHDFTKFTFDLFLTVFWIWVPMFYFGLKDYKRSILIWIVDIGLLIFILWLLHRKGDHRL